MAKLTGGAKPKNAKHSENAAETFRDAENTAVDASIAAEAVDADDMNIDGSLTEAMQQLESELVAEQQPFASTFDLSATESAGTGFAAQIASVTEAFDRLRGDWGRLDGHLTEAKSEISRLRGVEGDHFNLVDRFAEETAKRDELQAELTKVQAELENTRANEAAAKERAAKFEEICETIKERAYEMHMGLQQSRAAEQKVQEELASVQTELAELKRVAQDEAAARVVADDRNAKLTAENATLQENEIAARDRLAKVLDDNRAMASQVPLIISDRDKWQKQYSASERENARMQSERRATADRVADLETEIATLRSDLASLTASPARLDHEPTHAAVEESSEDDIDLVASLDKVFSQQNLEQANEK